MSGDDSNKLRLRRHLQGDLVSKLEVPHQPSPLSRGLTTSTTIRGRRKRFRRRQALKRWLRTCFSGIFAAILYAALSLTFLPFSWTQVDYHHQLQRVATNLLQHVVLNQRNHATTIRGARSVLKQVSCPDGSIGLLNDNYCDCLDGRDEPMTSACSHVLVHHPLFACKDDPSIRIYASRVKDGVRDCPDGSDEASV